MSEYPTTWSVNDRGPYTTNCFGPGAPRFEILRVELRPTEVVGAYATTAERATELAALMNGAK